MNQNWNARNSYGYVARSTKTWLHFHFPRSPDATFDSHIGGCKIGSLLKKKRKAYIHARSYFRAKCVFSFNGRHEFAKSRKGIIFRAWVRDILKNGWYLHASEKWLQFHIDILAFTKGVLNSIWQKQNRVLLKTFYWDSKSAISIEKAALRGRFQTWVRAWMYTGRPAQLQLTRFAYNEYRKVSNIRRTKFQNFNVSCLVLQLFCAIYWNQVLSREWRCSWSSADRRCFNYIWVIDNFVAY